MIERNRRLRALVFHIIGIGISLFHYAATRIRLAQQEDQALAKLKSSVTAVLERALTLGHTCVPASEMVELLCSRQKDVSLDAVLGAIRRLHLSSDIACRNDAILLPQAAHAEETIAHRLQHIGKRLAKVSHQRLTEWMEADGLRLGDEKRAAVSILANSPVAILSGDPGTGKTVTIKFLAAVLERAGYQVHLTAPTGRAAARLAEATGRPAQTLHRLLHSNRRQQLLRDLIVPQIHEAIIVDEASMLDLFLAERLVEYCTSRTKLIFVGDLHQLPPVGSGQVFRDLIESRQIPVIELSRSFRQSEGSAITTSAKRIKAGIVPELLSPAETKSDCYFIEADNVFDIQQLVVNAATRSLPNRYGADPHRDIQVLTPMRKGPLGTVTLNNLIRYALNESADESWQQSIPDFQPNDRILQTRNNYDLGVFNGECGFVENVSREAAVVRFGERSITYSGDSRSELTHAYAITIHRSQGSEYPFVIIPVHESQSVMLTRELLYTAMTRGKQMVILIGSRRAFAHAIGNTRSHRQTGLKNLLSLSVPPSATNKAA